MGPSEFSTFAKEYGFHPFNQQSILPPKQWGRQRGQYRQQNISPAVPKTLSWHSCPIAQHLSLGAISVQQNFVWVDRYKAQSHSLKLTSHLAGHVLNKRSRMPSSRQDKKTAIIKSEVLQRFQRTHKYGWPQALEYSQCEASVRHSHWM